jgi:hypothetical protein
MPPLKVKTALAMAMPDRNTKSFQITKSISLLGAPLKLSLDLIHWRLSMLKKKRSPAAKRTPVPRTNGTGASGLNTARFRGMPKNLRKSVFEYPRRLGKSRIHDIVAAKGHPPLFMSYANPKMISTIRLIKSVSIDHLKGEIDVRTFNITVLVKLLANM